MARGFVLRSRFKIRGIISWLCRCAVSCTMDGKDLNASSVLINDVDASIANILRSQTESNRAV